MRPLLPSLSTAAGTLGAVGFLAFVPPAAQALPAAPARPAAPPAVAAQGSLTLIASTTDFVEGTVAEITLGAPFAGVPSDFTWEQIAGPKVPLTVVDAHQAKLDVSGLEVAADVELRFALEVVLGGQTWSGQLAIRVRPFDRVPVLGPNVQIGGASTAVTWFEDDGTLWALHNVGGRLDATTISSAPQLGSSVHVEGFVHDVIVLEKGPYRYALLACGEEGIAIVDARDPYALVWEGNVRVNYFQDGLSFAEGGGSILTDQVIEGTKGDIRALVADGQTLWIGDGSYGIHRTALTNLLGPGAPVLEPDGTLLIDHEAYTLQYAGEVPWGAPLGMELVGDRLFVALQFLGLSIHDATTLERVGRYNLYTDTSVTEDWFLDLDVTQAVQPGFIDPYTGMPDYNQASYEILNSHGSGSGGGPGGGGGGPGGGGGGGGGDFPTPWADFDRYGKYYYQAQDVDVELYADRAVAYVAYGLGGLVAVDVTGFESAGPGDAELVGQYLAYVPGVPAHGPDEFIGEHNESIFPHFGAGMLKEAGVVDVEVRGRVVFYTDHFAGLVALRTDNDPAATWHGAAAPYDNDDGIAGNHVPDYEFVTSFDMSPYDPEDHESLPTWMYESPSMLVTGEVGGHGNSLVMIPRELLGKAGGIDVLLCLGGGGLDYVDLLDVTAPDFADRFDVAAYFPTTDEVGAAPDGSPTQTIAIGHAQGADASDEHLYLADGPHGVSAWKLVDDAGYPTDTVHLLANTVQDEYPVTVGTETVYPATHAYGVVYDPVGRDALTLCQGVGLRRVPVGEVEDGLAHVGQPLLLAPAPEDLFEHNGAWGKIHSVPKQDHAYDVALDGDLAFVADGGNGLTIYDLSKDPTDLDSGFFVSNLGGATKERPLLGRSTGVALWTDPSDGEKYALMAAGPYGVGVVQVSDPTAPVLVKTFEPIKLEDEKVGKADGRCVDVFVHGQHAWFSYDSFGVVCYALDDLVEPLPPGVPPTKIWKVQGGQVQYDHRPVAVGEFRLREVPEYADWGGGALNMTHTAIDGEPMLYVGYGVAGVVVLRWGDPAVPVLEEVIPTVGEASAVALSGGRIYVADGVGGLVYFK